MGCDIHLHIEVKISGKWEHYACPNIDRSYDLFEKMAGVRGSVEKAISPPKGLPHDISIITVIDSRLDYYHSHSWFNIEEIKELESWLCRDGFSLQRDLNHGLIHTYLFGNSFNLKSAPKEIQDIRFVFWFDN